MESRTIWWIAGITIAGLGTYFLLKKKPASSQGGNGSSSNSNANSSNAITTKADALSYMQSQGWDTSGVSSYADAYLIARANALQNGTGVFTYAGKIYNTNTGTVITGSGSANTSSPTDTISSSGGDAINTITGQDISVVDFNGGRNGFGKILN